MIAAAVLACGQKTDAAAGKEAPNAASTKPAANKWNLPPDHPPMGQGAGAMATSMPAGNPAAAPAAGGQLLTGKVLETMNAGGYTYLRLQADAGEVWAAVQQTTVKVGSPVTVNAQMTLENFKSQTLNRTFDHIIFGTVADPSAPQPAPNAAAAAQHIAGGAAPVGDVKVAKAEAANAKTVAELYAAKGSLKDAPVTIRGKVVKFLPQIMGKNWIHLRDGSGSADKGDHDVTVTTKDVVAVGDVVVVKGTVRLEKDFGAGYKYPIMVEDAKVTK
jgi:sporulation protein YlmC with PRC-barrel domain